MKLQNEALQNYSFIKLARAFASFKVIKQSFPKPLQTKKFHRIIYKNFCYEEVSSINFTNKYHLSRASVASSIPPWEIVNFPEINIGTDRNRDLTGHFWFSVPDCAHVEKKDPRGFLLSRKTTVQTEAASTHARISPSSNLFPMSDYASLCVHARPNSRLRNEREQR